MKSSKCNKVMHHNFVDVLTSVDCYQQPILLSTKQIKQQNQLIIGYIRSSNAKIIYHQDHIAKLLLLYSRFYGNPFIDPVNRISNKDVEISDNCRLTGNNLFSNKQYQYSIIKYNTAIHFNPNDHRIYSNRSLCYLLLNNLTASRQDAYDAITLCPTDAKSWYRLGAVAEKIKDFTSAYLAYRTANNIFEIINGSGVKPTNLYKTKFMSIKVTINSHQHRNDKLWIKYFDQFSPQKAFRLKLNYYLKISKLSKSKLLQEQTQKYYFFAFKEFFQLIGQSNAIKYMINRGPIMNISTKNNWSWCVSYATIGRIENNKRQFILEIVCLETGMIDSMHTIYGLPNAKHVVSLILKTIAHPDPDLYPRSYKPSYILIANRLKKEFSEIMLVMMDYGISCSLQTRKSAIEASTNMNTDADGYNYEKNREEYMEQREHCSNSKCKITRKILWKKYKKQFRMCSNCKSAFYCCRKCQKHDWKYDHRHFCFHV
eukprot:196236_1